MLVWSKIVGQQGSWKRHSGGVFAAAVVIEAAFPSYSSNLQDVGMQQ